MKRLLLITAFALSAAWAQAQSNDLIIHKETGSLYLVHKVVAKENWYSIGRIYNISPKEMAPYNGLTLNYSLRIGQELKIPLSHINFSQDGQKNADESFVPVYHVAQQNEALAHISALYDKVPVAYLEKWNRIKRGDAKQGEKLIVGYMKVKTSLSYLARGGTNKIDAVADTKNNAGEVTIVAKEEKKPAEVAETKQEEKHPMKNVAAPIPSPVVNQNKPTYTSASINNRLNGGYFSPDFVDGGNKTIGTAGTFKSTSGWNDGKYYVLINNVPVGTILKVIAPATQKSVFAKVLGQLPDMKESDGLLIRISNAAASELGEPEGKFGVQVKY
ncbi:MAG: LysM peptidoglycan-binding domain-containing protein [Bacteroidetes bacterium]|nr:LysM peptidoglycan-binding domain-containing protein [Bacteroidota bacterium]MBS1974413.1 LysM peptidoglycan-binding domain-containing protein [Bacteroidota bacterium]